MQLESKMSAPIKVGGETFDTRHNCKNIV